MLRELLAEASNDNSTFGNKAEVCKSLPPPPPPRRLWFVRQATHLMTLLQPPIHHVTVRPATLPRRAGS